MVSSARWRALSRLAARLPLAAALLTALPAAAAAAVPPSPNLVLILADDLGYGEIGAYGAAGAPTPNLDALARGGVRLTDGYVTAPQCAPTRAGLITGRYQQRFGFHNNPPDPTHPTYRRFGLPAGEVTLAEELRRRGYATSIVGKWHLGFQPQHHPLRRGFDSFFGFLSGGHSYVGEDPGNPLWRNDETVTEPTYLTRAFAREAVAFVDAQARRRFFLYVAFSAVHLPLQAEPEVLARFAHVADPKRRLFLAMLASFDEAVGAILDALRANGLERRTLVALTSDNGCTTAKSTCRNAPLRGGKGSLLEGGVRVPFLLSWPGVLPAGRTFDRPASTLDLFPTFLAAASRGTYRNARLDGVDLVPFLTGRSAGDPHAHLFWGGRGPGTARAGRWKLTLGPGTTALHDLRADVRETTDVAARQPAVVDALSRARAAWARPLPPPLWPAAPP